MLIPVEILRHGIVSHREIDQPLPLAVAIEGDHEPVDAKRHRAAEVFVFGGEVVFAEVVDGIEELAVGDVEVSVGSEDARGGIFVRGGDDQAVHRFTADVE